MTTDVPFPTSHHQNRLYFDKFAPVSCNKVRTQLQERATLAHKSGRKWTQKHCSSIGAGLQMLGMLYFKFMHLYVSVLSKLVSAAVLEIL